MAEKPQTKVSKNKSCLDPELPQAQAPLQPGSLHGGGEVLLVGQDQDWDLLLPACLPLA